MCNLEVKDIIQINNLMEYFKITNKFQCYNPKYNVLCCFFNNDYEIIGYNNTKNINSQIPIQTHAELDAMNKLTFKITKKMKFDCLVVRYTQNKFCCNSRPCYYCAKKLSEYCNCKIKNIFFYEDNQLKKTTLKELVNENTLNNLSSGFRYRMNLVNKKDLLMKKDFNCLLKRFIE